MIKTPTIAQYDVFISADSSSKPTVAPTPGDARGVSKHMKNVDLDSTDFDGKPYQDSDLLRELYVEQGMTNVEIAELLDCADCTVSEYRRRFGIKRRYQRASWLRKQYYERGQSLTEIAEMCDTDAGTVANWMERHGLERRTISEAQSNGDVSKLHDREWLETQYCNQERTTTEIADELGITSWTVSKWLERHSIEARNSAGESGEANANWAGGYENYYGANWGQKRTEVLERDGFACLVCGMNVEEHHKRYNRSLDVHHIRPVRTFDEAENANTLDNLVTLCDRCHKKWEGIPLRPDVAE
ncbi:HNH endonuclease [Natrinema zhouii]|uniref:HNH endonuclease n=1 Tax=Natrinema zhouii TaxID=1710539 RepID=A0A7D6GP17_9EURY|nr:HNH endonuclease [Natrinema zhouii]QLK25421.1 HNH endonuclease [Natrinema zhouii]